jgi:hypothetical protein
MAESLAEQILSKIGPVSELYHRIVTLEGRKGFCQGKRKIACGWS